LPFPHRKLLSLSQFSPSPPLNSSFAFGGVSFSELLYASCCVDEFLLPGKERVTVGTDIDVDVADGGTGLYCEATGTDHLCLLVLWMDAFFHNYLTITGVYNTLK
jgi:hypothetical protein